MIWETALAKSLRNSSQGREWRARHVEQRGDLCPGRPPRISRPRPAVVDYALISGSAPPLCSSGPENCGHLGKRVRVADLLRQALLAGRSFDQLTDCL